MIYADVRRRWREWVRKMITRTEAQAKLSADDERDYEALSARCEGALAKYHGQQITVGAEGFSQKAIERVALDGEVAGWTVVVQGVDQHNHGPFLVFS